MAILPHAKSRTRRLRKKLYTDEFAVYGMEISCTLAVDNFEAGEALLDEFVDFLISRELHFGGMLAETSLQGFVDSAHRYGSPSEEDRTAVQQWLEQAKACTNVTVGALVNMFEE